AAPELFDKEGSRHADQYSLALIYQEMLTGTHPHAGQARQVPGRGRRQVNLGPLPPGDRPAVARALAADPAQRFGSWAGFGRALVGGQAEPAAAAAEHPLLEAIISELATRTGPKVVLPPPPEGLLREENCLLRRYTSRLPLNLVRLKLD